LGVTSRGGSGREDWERDYRSAQLRDVDFETMSGIPLEPAYGPEAGEWPGVFPYTRGPYASMHRSKLWTMRMFAGFGTAQDTSAALGRSAWFRW
jgi:methylmalonyl-CoA mutase N-terminal domain/subunit